MTYGDPTADLYTDEESYLAAQAKYDRESAEYRATLQAMSDQAIRYQLANGARGGIQRDEIVREATRRGI